MGTMCGFQGMPRGLGPVGWIERASTKDAFASAGEGDGEVDGDASRPGTGESIEITNGVAARTAIKKVVTAGGIEEVV